MGVITSAREMGLASRKKRAEDKKSRKSVWHDHCECDLPVGLYQSRYGTNWMEKLPKSFDLMCITTIMDHVVAEGNRLFADTPFSSNWKIYHDALPQWWEKGAREHMRKLGFADRQWMATGPTNNLVSSRYRNGLMGDSPELMPLDSSLFNDLIEGISIHFIATGKLDQSSWY